MANGQEDWRWAWGSLALAVLAEDQRLGAVCLARKSQGGVGEGMGWPGWLGVQMVYIRMYLYMCLRRNRCKSIFS